MDTNPNHDILDFDFDLDYTPEVTEIVLTADEVELIGYVSDDAIDGTTFRAMNAMTLGSNTVEVAVLADILDVLRNGICGESARLADQLAKRVAG